MYRYINQNKGTFKKKHSASVAQFHIMICNARSRGLPNIMAWAAAGITIVSMMIWKYMSIGTPEIVPSLILFIIYGVIFQIPSRFTFLVLDMASRTAYNEFIMDEEEAEEDLDSEGFASNEGFNQSDTISAFEQAKTLFHITEPYDLNELKKIRNMIIKEEHLHPDEKGDPERFKRFMRAYDLLKEHIGE